MRALLTTLATVVVAAGGAICVPGVAAADEVRDAQWQLAALDAGAAWADATGAGVVVAVVDSGVDATHPDLAGQVLPGLDLVDGSTDGRVDPVGHGTSVAALIAGRGDDSTGVVGLAYQAKILPIRVLDNGNEYHDAMVVAQAVQWAVDQGARVINLSLGGPEYSPALADALDYAFARDVVVVACTGNVLAAGSAEVWYPAREPGVVAVTGLSGDPDTEPDPLWASSLTGPSTVLAAPAADLLTARPGGRYWRVKGTSFAAPLVSATAALIRARWPRMSAANVVQHLTTTARDVGPAGRDDRYGFGMVSPVAALRAKMPDVPANPLDTAPPPGVAGFGPATASENARDAPGQAAPQPPAVAGRGVTGPARW
ncbi:MAG TPA: type VII secretion-associated serine protease mycosin [Micromonosporaceae bacterium]|nr:type VII secretion-associated serine protease mycosin [Micromonosporaceae bacterium]